MVTYTWHNGEVPKDLKIKQVYGILFSEDGRTLLRHVQNQNEDYFSLAGGRPESYDNGIEGTLRREVIEEVNTTVKTPVLIGYQEADEGNGTPHYAQVRMVAVIEKIGPLQPDPDNGETYKRLLTTPQKAIELLHWGEEGRLQVEEAVRIAKEKLGLEFKELEDNYV